mgnify:CR=1 FL=1
MAIAEVPQRDSMIEKIAAAFIFLLPPIAHPMSEVLSLEAQADALELKIIGGVFVGDTLLLHLPLSTGEDQKFLSAVSDIEKGSFAYEHACALRFGGLPGVGQTVKDMGGRYLFFQTKQGLHVKAQEQRFLFANEKGTYYGAVPLPPQGVRAMIERRNDTAYPPTPMAFYVSLAGWWSVFRHAYTDRKPDLRTELGLHDIPVVKFSVSSRNGPIRARDGGEHGVVIS